MFVEEKSYWHIFFLGPALLYLILAVMNKKNVIKIYKWTEVKTNVFICSQGVEIQQVVVSKSP